MFAPDALEALDQFLAVTERLSIPFVIGGSVASSVTGLPRQTIDLDVVVVLDEGGIDALVRALTAEFYISAPAAREAVRHRRGFNLVHAASAFKIDVYVSGDSEFDRLQFEWAIETGLPGLPGRRVRIASPEDVVLRKLERYGLGHEVSDRQWQDVLGVMKVQAGRLDNAYLDRWASARGVTELLERARKHARANPNS